MKNYRETAQRNILNELISFVGKMTQENLNKQIEYLKVGNEIP